MLDTYGANIVLTWGFPPNCLQLVSRTKTAGIVTIWIDAPLLFCRLHWRPEAGQDEATLTSQKIAAIMNAWQPLTAFHRACAVSIATADFSLPEESIFDAIKRKANRAVDKEMSI